MGRKHFKPEQIVRRHHRRSIRLSCPQQLRNNEQRLSL
jgi:hypothetical protein